MKKYWFLFVSAVLCSLLLSHSLFAKPSETAVHQRFVLSDDVSKNASFTAFRAQLLDAVKRKDGPFVQDILSTDIETAIGGERGKQAFNERWQQLAPGSDFWPRMQRVLIHGAQLDRESDEFHAPAVSFEDSHIDQPQGIVWNKKAAMRKAPDDSSPLLCLLYDEQVTLLEPSYPSPVAVNWLKIRINNGRTGFMRSENIYSAYDEFAVFKRLRGKWCLTWFGFAGL